MYLRKIIRKLSRRRVQLGALSLLSAVLLAATVLLTLQVFLKLGEYGSAARDNMQHTIAQFEVDHVKLAAAADALMMPGDDRAGTFRRRFDAFYNRTATLRDGEVYRAALAGTPAQAELAGIGNELDRLIPIVDGPDAALLASQDRLSSIISGLSPGVERVAGLSVRIDARRADAERAALTSKLVELAVLSLLMLVALLSLMVLLWQLYRLYRRRAMENRATRNRLTTIFDTSQDAILVVRRDGAIADANKAAENAFALTGPDGRRKSVDDVLFRTIGSGEPIPVTGEMLITSCAEGPNRCANLSARDADGHFYPVELSADLANRAGNDVCVCFLRDISRRVATQSEIEDARNKALSGERAKARFLGMISHEMRTPLNGILGTLDLLEESGLSKEQVRYVEILQSSGQILLNQINDALELTRADAGRLVMNVGVFDLDALIDTVVLGQRSHAASRSTRLEIVRSGGTLGFVRGDGDRVQQVLLNLVTNAIKFTESGTVTIEAARGAGQTVEFQVSDTGIGIDEADLPRIFDDFVRVAEEGGDPVPGTGLGLGIVRQLVSLMGGTLGAESSKGDGSLFWVRLPLPTVEGAIHTPQSVSSRAPVEALDILVAEDNAPNRFVLAEMLRKDGHRVCEAQDGKTAVELAEERPFHLVLMDVSMPGIDGVEATRRIRRGRGASRDGCIVFLTAHVRPEEDSRLRSAGADAIYVKPIRRNVLRALLAGRYARGALYNLSSPGTSVDSTVLDQLIGVFNGESVANLLDRFFAEGDRFIDDMDSLEHAPPEEAADRLHRFAGSAATFGAIAMQSALCRAEAAVLDGGVRDGMPELEDISALWRQTKSEMRARRSAA